MTHNNQHILIVGGGPAGMEAAHCLGSAGYKITLFEKDDQTGGKLRLWYKLFPTFKPAGDLRKQFNNNFEMIRPEIITKAEVVEVQNENNKHKVVLSNGAAYSGDAILIATGYDVFDAVRKEEYGYGIYPNVITSVDLETILRTEKQIVNTHGAVPKRIAFIHCVGSRDHKVCNNHCSRLCCINGVKQAIEIKEMLPSTEIFNFYMDLRMFGQGYEELYHEAQQKYGITFIRGRVSEISDHQDGSLQLKAEDTLSGRPMKMKFDLVVLLVGMEASKGSKKLGQSLSLPFNAAGFLASEETIYSPNTTRIPGIFLAGTCKEPLSVGETLSDARGASVKIIAYLREKEQKVSN